jgi:hypothetical protein
VLHSATMSGSCVQENDAFFVMTNALITPNQTQGACSEVRHFSIRISRPIRPIAQSRPKLLLCLLAKTILAAGLLQFVTIVRVSQDATFVTSLN